MGQFYEGIKAQTKVMLNDPLLGQKASSEYLKVKYLRGLYAFTHMNTYCTQYSFTTFKFPLLCIFMCESSASKLSRTSFSIQKLLQDYSHYIFLFLAV